MPTRLADAASSYLLRYEDNPVDWYEWGKDAFAESRERDMPAIISVGHSSCHRCHGMEQESFEDEATRAAATRTNATCFRVH